jgi:hypothetical protein
MREELTPNARPSGTDHLYASGLERAAAIPPPSKPLKIVEFLSHLGIDCETYPVLETPPQEIDSLFRFT